MIDVNLQVDGFQAKTGTLSPRRYCYVLRNFERFGMSRPTQNGAANAILGLPDTCKLLYPVPVPLTPILQGYWFGLLKRVQPGWRIMDLIAAWRSLTKDGRAFTDHVSWSNGFADYIQKLNLEHAPMCLNPITCGGNVHEIIEGPMRQGGKDVYKIVTLDPDVIQAGDEEFYNREKHPELVFAATISRREDLKKDGTWLREDLENPFPQLGGMTVPVPLFSKGGFNFIEADRVREINPDAPFPNPYNPPLAV